jgi:hypothetical protein
MKSAGYRGRRQANRKRRGRQLWLELLEGRLAPATHTWTGGGGSNLWSNPDNWTGGTPVGDPSAVLIFPAVANESASNDLPGLNLDSITFTASGYSITGQRIYLGGANGITDNAPDAGTNLLALPVTLDGGIDPN